MLKIKTLWERYKFSPLYYEDGRPCYVRIGCLSACACCLLLSVALKDNSTPEMGSEIALNTVSSSPGAGASLPESKVGQNGVITMSASENFDDSGSLQHGAAATAAVAAAAATSTQSDGQEGVISAADLSSSSAQESVATAEDDDDDSWDFWAFFTGESKKKKERLAHRKAAIEELVNGAAFFTSCGNINAGYVGCRFEFSQKVSPYYDSRIEAADDGFMITLEAKGEQLKDNCVRFMVNSEGMYQAFDEQGNLSPKCLLNSGLDAQNIAIHRAVDNLQGNPAPSGARLAQK